MNWWFSSDVVCLGCPPASQNWSWSCIKSMLRLPSGNHHFRSVPQDIFVQIGLTRHVWSQMTSLDKSSIIQVVGRRRHRCRQASVISQSRPAAAQSAGAADQVLISLFLKHSFGSICFGLSSISQKTKKNDSFKLVILMTTDVGLIRRWFKKKLLRSYIIPSSSE